MKVTQEQEKEVLDLFTQGKNRKDIAKILHMDASYVSQILRDHGYVSTFYKHKNTDPQLMKKPEIQINQEITLYIPKRSKLTKKKIVEKIQIKVLALHRHHVSVQQGITKTSYQYWELWKYMQPCE